MPQSMQNLMEQYIAEIKTIYGAHLRKVILYGSYARGDYRVDSDVDLMILLDLSDVECKEYSQKLSYMTYDFNLDHDVDIMPIASLSFSGCIYNGTSTAPFNITKLAYVAGRRSPSTTIGSGVGRRNSLYP